MGLRRRHGLRFGLAHRFLGDCGRGLDGGGARGSGSQGVGELEIAVAGGGEDLHVALDAGAQCGVRVEVRSVGFGVGEDGLGGFADLVDALAPFPVFRVLGGEDVFLGGIGA